MAAQRHGVRCPICDVVFWAKRKDARYCGPKCRQAISRAVREAEASGKALKPPRRSGHWIV